LEFGVKVVNMARDNGLCVCVVKPHGVSDKPLGETILQDFDSLFDCAIDTVYLSSQHSTAEVDSQFTGAYISAAEIGSPLHTFCESITAGIAQQSTSTILMPHATPIKPLSLSPSTPHTLQNTGSLENPNRITRHRDHDPSQVQLHLTK
jgi:hypothetical protein